VREACESGKYNAIVLLGGGEPGFLESREIARRYGIPVTSCAFSQMHIASMLGNKFSVIDFAESHNMFYYDLVVRHRFTERCASIRSINYYHARPGHENESTIADEREKALRGEPSEAVERAVREAVAAIEEDGAEVITFGCSDVYWLQTFLQKRLKDMGWEIPVLEGYSSAIVLAKMFVDLGVDASGLNFPSDRPRQWRRKKVF
jgi:Asp/Glu/hydantoin racemase